MNGIETINNLKEEHIIKTMFREHEHILKMLDGLRKISSKIFSNHENNALELIEQANHLTCKLIEAEPHHQREEKVLFPAIEKKGISGPGEMMTSEHVLIRKIKHELKNETEKSIKNWPDHTDSEWPNHLEKICHIISALCANLEQHIRKENNILYPIALKVITDESEWEEMKKECDKIGYCCFCPSEVC